MDSLLKPSDHAEQQYPSSYDAQWVAAQGALQAAASHLAGSASAGPASDGGGETFSASFSALLDWGEQNELIRPEGDFAFLSRQTDGHGDEHEAWFDQDSNRWFKATYKDRFGLAWGRDGSATAREYLFRLVLQNAYFGDDIRLVALLNCGGRLRVLTSQPHIAGEAATYGEIQEWFGKSGFCRVEYEHRIAWYLRSENLLVADAHEGNVIRTEDGVLVPIDLNLTRPTGALFEWASSAAWPIRTELPP